MTVLGRQRWWVTRLLVLPVHVLVFALAAFFLVRLVPGDPVLQFLGEGSPTPEEYARVETALGLNGSLLEQFGRFIGNLVQGDFGTSIATGRPVTDELLQRVPVTLQLALVGMVATIVVAALASYVAAAHPSSIPGRILRGYGQAAGALPDFALGVISIFLFYVVLAVAPAPIGLVGATESLPPKVTGFSLVDALIAGDTGVFSSLVSHLTLPVLVLAIGYAPLIMKVLVPSLEQAIDSPATRFRVATGSKPWIVVVSIYRRALPSAVVICGMLFGGLLGGSVVLDQLFSLGGIGQFAVTSINANDFPVMQGFLVLTAALSLVVYFLVDVVNMLLDPRRRPGVSSEA